MKAFGTLFFRDLKKTGAAYISVIAIWLALCASTLWLFDHPYQTRVNIISMYYIILFAVHPVLLSLSFSDESLTKSDQQWFALPVRHSTVVVSRVLSMLIFLSISMLAVFIWSLIMVRFQIDYMENTVKKSEASVELIERLVSYHHNNWWDYFYHCRLVIEAKIYSLCSFIFISTVVLIQSLRYSVKRYNGYLRNISILAIFIMFCRYVLRGMDMSNNEPALASIIVTFVVGAALILAGLVIFDKAAEV